MSAARIAIAGAGIAGLTAALAFARKGAEVTVVEQAEALNAVGAGLQLSPNASCVLRQLGILDSIEARWQEIERISLVSGINLRHLGHVPAGRFARRRWKAPYGVLLRADLQDVLLGAVRALPNCRLILGRRIGAATPEALRDGIAAIAGAPPTLVIGADGVRSAVREAVRGHGAARFSGHVAWRIMAGSPFMTGLPVEPGATTAFLGPSTHLVAYRPAGTEAVNLVAVTHGSEHAGAAEAPAGMKRAFARWHPRLRAMLAEYASKATAWPLLEVSDGAWHSSDGTVLIGDAAHAMMPFAAQGAAMAIEDAFELAEAFAAGGVGALDGFVSRRKARVERVRRRTAFNRFAYHVDGPLRLARDAVLMLRRPENLAADLDWLYGWNPCAATG